MLQYMETYTCIRTVAPSISTRFYEGLVGHSKSLCVSPTLFPSNLGQSIQRSAPIRKLSLWTDICWPKAHDSFDDSPQLVLLSTFWPVVGGSNYRTHRAFLHHGENANLGLSNGRGAPYRTANRPMKIFSLRAYHCVSLQHGLQLSH